MQNVYISRQDQRVGRVEMMRTDDNPTSRRQRGTVWGGYSSLLASKAELRAQKLRSCAKVEVAVLGSASRLGRKAKFNFNLSNIIMFTLSLYTFRAAKAHNCIDVRGIITII